MISKKIADGSLWPIPGDEMREMAWRLTNVDGATGAASVLMAYRELIRLPQRERNAKIEMIRRRMSEEETP